MDFIDNDCVKKMIFTDVVLSINSLMRTIKFNKVEKCTIYVILVVVILLWTSGNMESFIINVHNKENI